MEEKLYFKNSKGDRICGILSNPAKCNGNGNSNANDNGKGTPVIILCHGFSTCKDSYTNKRLQEILNQNGAATFRLDFFGHGESDGLFEDITISEAVDDIFNAVGFLKGRGYERIGLVGSSFGGISALMAASKSRDIFALVLKSPVSNYEEIILEKESIEKKSNKELDEWRNRGYTYYISGDGKERRLNYAFFEDFKNNDGYEAARKIMIPTLIVHGDMDEVVPVKQSKKTAGIIKRCRIEIIMGADHKYSNPGDFERMIDLISKFILSQCREI